MCHFSQLTMSLNDQTHGIVAPQCSEVCIIVKCKGKSMGILFGDVYTLPLVGQRCEGRQHPIYDRPKHCNALVCYGMRTLQTVTEEKMMLRGEHL